MADSVDFGPNQRTFRKLVLSIQANPQELNLLLAVCDDANLREKLISEYERELRAVGFRAFRTRLKLKQPSLRASLAELVQENDELEAEEPAVVTVLDASYLLGVRLSEEKSEQEKFFFSLQWTREALRQFKFPVVLWLSDAVATELGRQAPDFWSWRRGVFEFVAEARAASEKRLLLSSPSRVEVAEKRGALSVEDLQQQVEELEESSPKSSLLISSYNALGEAYERIYAYDEALNWYQKGLELSEGKNNLEGQARSLHNLGDSLRYSGRVFQSTDYYKQASELARRVGNRQGEANALGNLGIAYDSLGEYQRAIEFHQQHLEIAREIGDHRGEANALGNLGIAYHPLGEYQRAIEFHQQNLEIAREIGDRRGEANSQFNTGFALDKLDQNDKAQAAFEAARTLYDSLGLDKDVEDCDRKIQALRDRP